MIVGCTLPTGYTIEVGTPGKENYEFFNIPGGSPKKPGAAAVPDSIARSWFRKNAKLRYVVDGALYLVK